MKIFIPILFLCFVVFVGCYSDNEETLYEDYLKDCIVTEAFFVRDIQPIFVAKCDRCHSESNAPISGDGIDLGSYEKIVEFEKKYPNILVQSLKQEGGALPMPRGDRKLDICNIKKVEFWVNDSLPNN